MAASEVSTAPRRPLIPRAFVEMRRRRYVDAVAELLHEFSRHELSVTSIVRLAGTARSSFYEVFDSAQRLPFLGVGLALEQAMRHRGAVRRSGRGAGSPARPGP